MNRIKVVKNHNYTTINNTPLKDRNLSLKAKGLLAIIMSLPPDWDFSIKGIIAIVKEGRDAVYSAIKELIENNYCIREQSKSEQNGEFSKFDYTFFENPNTDNPHTENPNTDNPHTDYPHTENPNQLSKEEINPLTDKVKNKSSKKEIASFIPKNEKEKNAFEVLEYLNEQRKNFLGATRNFEPTKTHFLFITARLEKYSVEDLKAVIDLKMIQWASNTKMKDYLVPKTLFNDTNFQNYIQQVDIAKLNPQQFINEQRTNTNGKQRPDSVESLANIYSGLAEQLGGK